MRAKVKSRTLPAILAMVHAMVVAVGLAASGCSSLEIEADHDPQADFSSYRTYAWSPEASSAATPGLADISGVPSPLVESRVRVATDGELAVKGLKRVEPSRGPDLYVKAYMTQREIVRATDTRFGAGYATGGWFSGIGVPVESTYQYTEGTLVLDLIDAKNRRLVWRGIASAAAEDLSKDEINDAVAKTFERYPPRNASG